MASVERALARARVVSIAPVFRLAVAGGLWIALALAGGASRFDEDQQAVVRLFAVAAIAASFWPLRFDALLARRGAMFAVGAAYALVLLQLIPLPPSLWAALPGHHVYAEIAAAAGAETWRPLSLTPDLTLNALLAMLPATAAALAYLYLDDGDRQRLQLQILVVAAVSAALGLVQLAIGETSLRFYRETSEASAVGLFANRNHQAAFLACALPLAAAVLGARLREGGRRPTLLAAGAALAVLLLAGVLATGSRMGLALAALGLVGAAACLILAGQLALPKGWGARLAVLAAVLAFAGGVLVGAERAGTFHRQGPTGETRVAMLAPLARTAAAFMPLGSGFGSFDGVYRQFEPKAMLSTIYMNEAHDEPLQLAIEGGLPALALLAGFLLWWARASVRAVAGSGARRRAMGLAAVTVSAILMLSSLVDYPLRTPLLSALFAIACVELLGGAARAPRAA